MNRRIARFLAGGATALVLAGAVGATALAQSAPPTPPGKAAAQAQADAFLNALAAKLGKTPDEVRNAAKAAQKDLVSQALQAGRITQEQANRLNQRIDQSNGMPFGPGKIGPGPKAPGAKGAPAARATFGGGELAQFLGVTPQVLKGELGSGKSLAQVAQAHGKSADQLKTFVRDQAKARLDAQVKAGRVTQAQADAALKKLTDNLDQMINRVPPARGKGDKAQPKKAAFSL
jgi:hypothetical protein